jgi:DNA-binding GntR family transcriptional regulator
MIQSGELQPGARLRQAEIAKDFGVSTTPVREAFTALALEGLVRQDAHRGAVVFEFDIDDLHENYEIRGALEPLATELAASNMGPKRLEELDRIIQQMRLSKRSAKYQRFNRQFHATIYEAAARPRLVGIIESLRDASEAYFARLNQNQDPSDPYYELVHYEHEAIAAALRAGDAAQAGALMAEHLDHNRRQLESLTTRTASA